ncbi:hypothetical protein BV509_09095 [Rhodovulum sulfidophilum]|uniref:Phage gp6-like head-tail connector protein n=1 Tax=Rhodovulum visakhapatnamense TaxID=364297 RepID=A0ABS1RHU3_9RHOB|nr:head-tail connector protein [Rhodovulum visakhapatnamense]MBL3568865.1 phage gp6-like head-tail connector protein [Rhodovulum visakhapatnamense]MBL3579227.1 phage gp6-like head-tail connector protein [Rhodovulum visakhapatnamense]OLS44481.1 hypothetical protein BV509_09095 [Rhodovulum sulfidophilum]
MDLASLIAPTKAHARVDTDDEDATIELMLAAAAGDVLAAAEVAEPADAADLPTDLRFAICDQAAMLFDARGGDTERPVGLSLAAARIVARHRGVRVCLPTSE